VCRQASANAISLVLKELYRLEADAFCGRFLFHKEGSEFSHRHDDPLKRKALYGGASLGVFGDVGFVGILLERDDVNPDSVDKDGKASLSHAAFYGNGKIVRML